MFTCSNCKWISLSDEENTFSNMDECLICFSNVDIKSHINLDSIKYSSRNCNCKAIMHKKCFYEWYNTNQKCPVCSTSMVLKDPPLMVVYKNRNKIFLFTVLITYVTGLYFYIHIH